MRVVQPLQPQLGELAIADIEIDIKSRDEIAQLLRGLQYIYVNADVRGIVFPFWLKNNHLPKKGVFCQALFILAREEGYATEIARLYETDLSPIQKQLDRLERDGLLVNKKVGRTRVYQFNPRYAFLGEVKQLLAKAL
ncbi:MAG: winged helix-turn-helix domain-containing protein, partial [Pseudomonadales bacterium]